VKSKDVVVLLGVGSADIFSPMWKLRAINPKSEVAKQLVFRQLGTAGSGGSSFAWQPLSLLLR